MIITSMVLGCTTLICVLSGVLTVYSLLLIGNCEDINLHRRRETKTI